MGLLDGFFSDDPRQQAQLALAMGLLSGGGVKGVGGFARDLGRAGIGAQSAYNQASLLKDKRAEEEQQRKFREMQMGQMQRGIEDQNFAQQLAPNFFQAQNAPADGTGPVAPPKADFAGYGQAIAARNPQLGAQFMAMAPKPAQPQFKEVGGRLVRIDGDNVKEAYAPPDKPKDWQDPEWVKTQMALRAAGRPAALSGAGLAGAGGGPID